MCKKSNTEEFIFKAKLIHGETFNYSKVKYEGAHTKIIIICKKHGEFTITPHNFLQHHICRECSNELISKIFLSSSKDFIEKAKLIHGDKYNYSKVNYINNKIKVVIICPIHGEFSQIPNNHLNSYNCPICCESKGEKEISKILTEMKIGFERQRKFEDCKNIKALPFDFFIESKNILIEFNGIQHYEFRKRFHRTIEGFYEQQIRDKLKADYCLANNIKLIIIKYNEPILVKLIGAGVIDEKCSI